MAAIEFIESNLDKDLSSSMVASQVGYSKYHFHRIFRSSTGESVADYIRKRRLARALNLLVSTDKPIYDIALSAHFDSQESFTRAFKKMYGQTPGRFRKANLPTPINFDQPVSAEMLEHLNRGLTMEPTYKERKEELAIGIGGSFKEESFKEINALWNTFNERMSEIENVVDGYSFGVCLEGHSQIEIKDGDSFIYFAALPVSSVNKIPDGMHVVQIPENRYAVFTHKGPIADISKTVKYIWGTWIPRNSESVKKDPDFELYDERFNLETLDGEVDIYVPVRR